MYIKGSLTLQKIDICIKIVKPMEHLRVLENLLKHVSAFQTELEFGSVFKERGKPKYPEKTVVNKLT